MSTEFKQGDPIVISHPHYGTLRGTVHRAGKSVPYLPLGIGHLNLGARLAGSGWEVVEDDPRIVAITKLLDEVDVQTDEALQASLVDEIRKVVSR